jgi:Tol biopolymer transport system component
MIRPFIESRPAVAAIAATFLLGAACARRLEPVAPAAPSPPARTAAQSAPAPGAAPSTAAPAAHQVSPIELPAETHLRNVRKLTSGGENAEAYWSSDGKRLSFQRRSGDRACDEIVVMDSDGSNVESVASQGAHTCSYFLAGDERIVFSSTMSVGPDCPPPPDRSKGYVWAIHDSYDIYSARVDGGDVRRLTATPGYDAEATVARDGRIVFTSVRDGDLDIYVMNEDGGEITRLTDTMGYDGGAFFSPDGTKIIYRARHVTEAAEAAEYALLLVQGLVRPSRLEIWVMDADGSNQRQITSLGHAAFAPSFLADGERVIFSSNHEDPKGRNFDLYLVRLDGSGLERVTFNDTFDGFPLLSPDGTRLAFCSNRGNAIDGETNVFVADWID